MNPDLNKGMTHLQNAFVQTSPAPVTYEQSFKILNSIQVDLKTAESDGVFAPLPNTEPTVSKDVSRLKTIRNRLFLLGYLDKDSGRGNLDGNLKQAIARFQSEAGLKSDGWVGDKETWPALQELVSFETPLNVQRWYRDASPMPALKRSIALRLSVLGFTGPQSVSTNVDIEAGLSAFGNIWHLLKFGETQSLPGLNSEWIRLLFDQDGLTRNLANVDIDLAAKNIEAIHGFIINVAKIELWLMGYPVRPGGYDLKEQKRTVKTGDGLTKTDIWMKSETVTQFFAVKRRIRFHKALHSFWIDSNMSDSTADQYSVNFLRNFPEFFKIVDVGIETDQKLSNKDRQSELLELIREKKNDIPLIWKNLKKIGARVWDGIRRVWGWFKRIGSIVKEKAFEIGTNLFRMIYDYASSSFTIISNIFKSFSTAVDFIINPILPIVNPDRIVFYRDVDFDLKVVIDTAANDFVIDKCCADLCRKAHLFSFGCQIIGTFMSILMDVLRSGWTAYLGLVYALLKFRHYLHRFRALTDQYRTVFPGSI